MLLSVTANEDDNYTPNNAEPNSNFFAGLKNNLIKIKYLSNRYFYFYIFALN